MGVVPVAIFKPSGSRDQAGAITPSVSGAVWDTTLDGAPAWRVLEGTVNLFANPFAKGNPGGMWQAWGSGVTSSLVSGRPEWSHGTAWKVDGDGTAPNQGMGAVTAVVNGLTGARTYIGHVDAVGSGTFKVWVRVQYTDATAEETPAASAPSYTLGPTPQRLTSIAFTSNPAKTIQSVLLFARSASAQVCSIVATLVQIEEKAYATPFCPAKDGVGVILPGQNWNGTPDASTSTRTAGSVSIPSLGTPEGTIYARMVWPAVASNGYPISLGEFTAGLVGILRNSAVPQIYIRSGGAAVKQLAGSSPNADNLNAIALSWGAFGAAIRVNGVTATTAGAPTIAWANPAPLGVGSVSTSPTTLAVALQYSRPLTDAELAKLDATPTALLGWDSLADKPGGILRVGSPDPVSILRVGADPIAIIRGGA